MHKLKWIIVTIITVLYITFNGPEKTYGEKNATSSPAVQKVQIESIGNGYQMNISLLNSANVSSISIGTQNPFGGMPHDVVKPSSVHKQSDGTWTAYLGSQIPQTLTLYRRLWILPNVKSGQSSTYKWENDDFNITYKIKSGDTLYRISKSFNLPLSIEVAANRQFHNPAMIYPGDAVNIAYLQPIPPMYQVKSGDTLFRIAQKYNISLGRIIMANPQIKNPNLIMAGQTVKLPQKFY